MSFSKSGFFTSPASQPARTGGASTRVIFLAWAAIILIYILLRINLINIPLDRDEGAFGYIGRLILDGGMPYKDAIDHNPPLLFYIYAFALLFVPPTAAGVHIFLHLYNFLTLVTVYFIARVYFRSVRAGLWAALSFAVLSAGPYIQGYTASSEMFMLLPITLSLLLALLASRRQSAGLLILSGVAGAAACWIKQTAVASLLFVVIYLAFNGVSSSLRGSVKGAVFKGVARDMSLWVMGGIGISALIIGYFLYKGVLHELIYWSFTHGLLYAKQGAAPGKFTYILGLLYQILRGDFVIIAAGLSAGIIFAVRGKSAGFFIMGFLFFAFLGTIPGYAFRHYFAQLAPPMALAAGFGFASLCALFSRPAWKAAAALILAAMMVAVPLSVNAWYYLEPSVGRMSNIFYGDDPYPELEDLGRFISGRTTAGDNILILGAESQILFYAGRKSTIPFITIHPLTRDYPRNMEFQEKAWEEIKRRRPKYIIFVNIPESFAWDRKAKRFLLKQTGRLIKIDYQLEAVTMVRGVRGEPVIVAESDRELLKDVFENPKNIYVYRRK